MDQTEFQDPRLVAVYDQEYPWSVEDDFFCSVIAEFAPPASSGVRQRVLDLGCGTGRLATGLVQRGYAVTGVDPARASLDFARARPGADAVTWIEGTSRDVPRSAFEAAVMSKHVSQFFVSDEDWETALRDISSGLVPDGILTFDMRDARAREWDSWTAEAVNVVVLADGRSVEEWTEITAETASSVSFQTHYAFSDGTDLSSSATLAFRDVDQLRLSLSQAGFTVDHLFGGWRRQPVGHGDGEILVLARRLG